MKISRAVGSSNQILQIFIQDATSTQGSGLGNLTYLTAGLSAIMFREHDNSITQIPLVSGTMGTYIPSGFIEVNYNKGLGWYQFCPPNSCFNQGAQSVALHLTGATNMCPCPIEIDLDAQADVYRWLGSGVLLNTSGYPLIDVGRWLGTTVTAATAGIPDVNTKNYNNQTAQTDGNNYPKVDVVDFGGVGVTGRDIGASVLLSSGVGAGQVLLSAGIIQSNSVQQGGINQTGRDLGASVLLASGVGAGQVLLSAGIIQANTVQFGGQNTLLDGNNYPKVDVVDFGGVGVTGRDIGASVLLSSGVGVGQVLLSAGILQDNAVQFAGHAVQLDTNNYPYVDIKSIANATVNTSLAQIGINVVNWNGSSVTDTVLGIPDVNVAYYNTQTAQTDSNNLPKVDSYYLANSGIQQVLPVNFSLMAIDVNGRAKIQSGFTTNTAFNDFEFKMISSSDHISPAIGITVLAQRSINGGTFNYCTNASATEIGSGIYYINLSAADLNGNAITFHFTPSGAGLADTNDITVITTP